MVNEMYNYVHDILLMLILKNLGQRFSSIEKRLESDLQAIQIQFMD